MHILLKKMALYGLYLKAKFKYRKQIQFNGYSIFYAHHGSVINVDERGGVILNSTTTSNLVGVTQPTIISCRDGGVINIGYGVGISGSTIYSLSKISLGDNVIIGSGCKIIDNDFHPLEPEKRVNQKDCDIKRAPITIGANSFVGMNSIILKGTNIGKNCIIGAGSVVHGTFPDNVIIAGNPAKIIKQITAESNV